MLVCLWISAVCSSDLAAWQLASALALELAGQVTTGAVVSVTVKVVVQVPVLPAASVARSEERRVGKECRSRWSPDQYKKNALAGLQLSLTVTPASTLC